LQAGDGTSVSAGMIIRTTSGTGSNQLRMIIATLGYGTDVVAINRDWSTIPDNTTTYNVHQGMLFETGFAASGAIYGDPNPVTSIVRCFSTAAADVPTGSQRVFYEKVFTVNNNTATALSGAQVEIASETPSLPAGALLDLGPAAGLNDTATIANRQTAPGGVSFTSQAPSGVFINVPSPGNLPSGAAPNAAGAQAWWLRLTLPAGTAAYKGSADLRTQGTTV
jgi:hypothetical protein